MVWPLEPIELILGSQAADPSQFRDEKKGLPNGFFSENKNSHSISNPQLGT